MGDDDFDDDEPPETGHAVHFLGRVAERVELDQAELALRLYRDRPLVRALLAEERTGAERIALALAEGPAPPHAIVERGGAFVTCLGSGMVVGEGAPVPFARVRLHIERADLLAARQARAQELWRDRSGVRQLLERCDDSGGRLCREDFAQLVALAPILEARYLDKATDAFVRVRRVAPRVLRLKRLPPSIEPKLKRFWNRFHAVGHYLLLATVRGKQSFALLDRTEVSPRLRAQGFEPFRHLYYQPLVLGRGYVALRLFAAIARAGELAIPEAKRRMAEAETMVRWLLGAYALVAIAHRHRKLRGELTHAVGPARLPAFAAGDPSAIAAAKVLQTITDGVFGQLDDDEAAQLATRRRLAEALVQGLEGEASTLVEGDDLSFARLAAMDWHFLAFQQDVGWLATAVALCAEAAPEELYFPAAARQEGPAFTPEAAQACANFVPQPPAPRRVEAKPGRNEPCACGSGKKWKRCCGA